MFDLSNIFLTNTRHKNSLEERKQATPIVPSNDEGVSTVILKEVENDTTKKENVTWS